MALDPSIALGIKPVQIESPINQMAKMYEMQNAVQANKLNQLKMDEYARGVAEAEEFKRNMLGVDASTPQGQQSIYTNLLRAGRVDDAAKFAKNIVETANLGLTGKKTQGDIAKQRQEFDNQAKRDLSFNPSDENIKAFSQDAVLKGIYTQEEAARATAQLLSIPMNQRQAFLAGQGATAGDISTAATAKAGQAITMRGQDITAKTTREGQLMTDARERQRISEGNRKDVVASTLTDAAGNVTQYNKFGELIGTKPNVGKPSATFEKTAALQKQMGRDLDLAITEIENAIKKGGTLDKATASGAGKLVDAAGNFIGYATEGSIAAAELKPIADLGLKMVPRFEGPQSDKDTASYIQASGQLANESLPVATRRAAAETVVRLMKSRKGQFVNQTMANEGIGAGAPALPPGFTPDK